MISENGFVSYSEYEDLLERYKEIKELVEEYSKQDLYVVTDFQDEHEFEIELSKNQLEKFNELKKLLGHTMEDIFIEKVEKYEEGMF